MVGGAGAAGPAPDLQYQPPSPRVFRKQLEKVGLGIYVGYKRLIWDVTRIPHKQFSHPDISQVYLRYILGILLAIMGFPWDNSA